MEFDADATVDGVLISAFATAAPPFFFRSCSGSGKKVEHPNVSDGVCFGFKFAMVAKTWNRSSRRTLPNPPAESPSMGRPSCRATC